MQISDIHIGKFYVSAHKIKKIISKNNPDIIVMTGDYIEEVQDLPKFIQFLKSLHLTIPTYACLGNHDLTAFSNKKEASSRFEEELSKMKITLLHNSSVQIMKNSKKYTLVGIDDLRSGEPDIKKATSDISKDSNFNIAFSHNPDIVFDLSSDKINLLLSGHFHGGQIRTPFYFEFKVLRKERLCKLKITRGLHTINHIYLYINRGIGNVKLPFRFLSKPEIAFFYIE